MQQDNRRIISPLLLIIGLIVIQIVFSGCVSKENQDIKINTGENPEYQISDDEELAELENEMDKIVDEAVLQSSVENMNEQSKQVDVKDAEEKDSSNSEQAKQAETKKVSIRAYLNLSGCQTETTDLLDGLVKQYKGQVSVEYIDFSTKEGYDRTVKDGLDCAGLVINEKQTHTIKDKNDKQREVTFSHPINLQYTADDVIAVIKQLLD